MSGVGKSYIAAEIARLLKLHYLDGDHCHRARDLMKMKLGRGLSQSERSRYVRSVCATVTSLEKNDYTTRGVVCACSLLNKLDRARVKRIFKYSKIIQLVTPESQRIRRVHRRRGHFGKIKLAISQVESFQRYGYVDQVVRNHRPSRLTPIQRILKVLLSKNRTTAW